MLLLTVLCLNIFYSKVKSNAVECDIKDFPYYVHFHHVSANKTTLCGGSLISLRSVLTAAHCCEGRIEGKNVTIGSPKGESCVQYIPIWKVQIHSSYKAEVPDYDYCILTLERYVKIHDTNGIVFLPEIEELRDLLNPFTPQEENFWVMGYNETGENLECVATQLSIDEAEGCTDVINNNLGFNHNTMFCHYALTYATSECVGDPGSPIVYRNKQVGLVSWTHDKKFCFDDIRVGSRLDRVFDWIIRYGHLQYGMRSRQITAKDTKSISLSLIVIYVVFL